MSMTLETKSEPIDQLVERAMRAFDTTIDLLDGAVEQLKTEDVVREKHLLDGLRAMNDAFLFALKMEAKARETAAKDGAITLGGQLDLDAAREEIGLRLACLRAAGGNDGVS